MSNIKSLYEDQSGGYPLEQVMVIESRENEPMICAFFADADMDVFMVEYSVEGVIVFHAADVTHIATLPYQLGKIAALAPEAAALNAEVDAFMDEKAGTWVGHEHLITNPNFNNPSFKPPDI